MAELEQPAPAFTPTTSLVDFNFRIPALVPALAIALIIRLLLASLPGFGVDTGTFQAWAQDLAANQPWNFYQADKFTDYAPGYMYILWLIGELNNVLHFNNDQWVYILKIPAIIADMASAVLIYRMLDKQSPTTQLGATLIYLFFPPALLVGAFWGQVDSILAFFLLLTVYFLANEKPVAGAAAFAVGFLVKPQAIAALPLFVFWILRRYPAHPRDEGRDMLLAVVGAMAIAVIFGMRLLAAPSDAAASLRASEAEDFFATRWSLLIPIVPAVLAALYLLRHDAAARGTLRFRKPPRIWLECTVVPVVVVLILITPFFKLHPWELFGVLEKATNIPNYRVNSFWGYNFWNTGGLFKMGFHCDIDSACQQGAASQWLGIDTRYWSVLLFVSSVGIILYLFRHAKDTGMLALGTALSTMAFYLLLTRMHERYVFAAFLPFLVACALIQSRVLWGAFVVTAFVHFANLYHVFGYYFLFADKEKARFPDWVRWPDFYHWLEDQHDIPIFSKISFIGGLEAVQIFSIIFVTTFVVLLGWVFYSGLKPPAPTGAHMDAPPEAT